MKLFFNALIVLFALNATALQVAQADVEFDVEYQDSAGSGFLSTTPTTPVGGNPGTTLGEQRRIAFEQALGAFATRLTSSVPIHIQANFENFGGTSSSATLASAGPEWFNYNFSGAPQTNIAYPSALANKISGMDLSDASRGIADISLSINEDIDGTALGNSSFYYGLDGRSPGFDIDFITVVSHELIHGLGFLSAIDPITGHKFGCSEASCRTNEIGDIFSVFLARRSQSSNTALLNMSQDQRLAAVTANGQVVWTGSFAKQQVQDFTFGLFDGYPKIYTPSSLQLGSTLSHTDMSLSPSELMQPSYSGAMNLSKLSLSMLSDMGWGTAGDLSVSLRQLDSNTEANSSALLASITHTGSTQINSLEILFTTDNGTLAAPEHASICSSLSSSQIQCRLSSLLPAQISDISLEIKAPTAQVTAVLVGDLLELEPSDNSVTLSVVASTTDDSTTDDSATDDSTTDDSTTNDSTTNDSTTDDSTTDDSTTDDSTTDDSTTDDSTTDGSTTDGSTANTTPASEEPAITPPSSAQPTQLTQSGGSLGILFIFLLLPMMVHRRL